MKNKFSFNLFFRKNLGRKSFQHKKWTHSSNLPRSTPEEINGLRISSAIAFCVLLSNFSSFLATSLFKSQSGFLGARLIRSCWVMCSTTCITKCLQLSLFYVFSCGGGEGGRSFSLQNILKRFENKSDISFQVGFRI